jgi:hypothetical protein
MAGMGTTSWNAPMPESLAETWIDYPTGLQVEQGCTEDSVSIAVPVGTQLAVKPGCSNNSSGIDSVVKRAGEWIRDLMR